MTSREVDQNQHRDGEASVYHRHMAVRGSAITHLGGRLAAYTGYRGEIVKHTGGRFKADGRKTKV